MSQHSARAMPPVCAAAARLFLNLVLVAIVFSPRFADAQALPTGWTGSNIGSATPAGRASFASDTFTVEGGGTRVYSTADEFFFVHRQMTGDGTIVARVGSVENTDSWAKAGVMIRESLAANSKHAFALVTPGHGAAFHRRTTTGGTTSGTRNRGIVAPIWLRLVRSGSTLTAARSTNGTTWTTIGSATISMTSTVYVGLAVSSYNTSALATGTFSNVNVSTPTALPTGWTSVDVGGPSLAGSSTYSSSTFTVSGAGTDIWSTADQFRFVYRQVSGDVDVIARVASFQGPDDWSKAGVMVRASLSASAQHVSMLVTPTMGLAFQRRPASGMSTLHTSGGTGSAPVWIKLERRGSAVTAFRSATGTSWTLIGSETLTLPTTFYVGLAVTSHATATLGTAQFTDVTVGTGSTPVPTPTPPAVSLTSPSTGATFTAPASISIAANASDADNGVAMVEFYANGTLLGTDATSPYTFAWSGVPAGSYSLTAVARDNGGATTTSTARAITVSGGTANTPPTVSLTAPAAGSTYVALASITISANAADSDGTIARVDFYAGATLVGSDTTSPYSVTWGNAAAGSYALTAVARDNAGATTTSAARSVTVTSPVMPTTAVFGASPDHATVTRYVLDVFTAGANPATATPMATQSLGKPSVVNGECTADIRTTISGLPGGSYFATVVAVTSGGTSTRAISAVFAR